MDIKEGRCRTFNTYVSCKFQISIQCITNHKFLVIGNITWYCCCNVVVVWLPIKRLEAIQVFIDFLINSWFFWFWWGNRYFVRSFLDIIQGNICRIWHFNLTIFLVLRKVSTGANLSLEGQFKVLNIFSFTTRYLTWDFFKLSFIKSQWNSLTFNFCSSFQLSIIFFTKFYIQAICLNFQLWNNCIRKAECICNAWPWNSHLVLEEFFFFLKIFMFLIIDLLCNFCLDWWFDIDWVWASNCTWFVSCFSMVTWIRIIILTIPHDITLVQQTETIIILKKGHKFFARLIIAILLLQANGNGHFSFLKH